MLAMLVAIVSGFVSGALQANMTTHRIVSQAKQKCPTAAMTENIAQFK